MISIQEGRFLARCYQTLSAIEREKYVKAIIFDDAEEDELACQDLLKTCQPREISIRQSWPYLERLAFAKFAHLPIFRNLTALTINVKQSHHRSRFCWSPIYDILSSVKTTLQTLEISGRDYYAHTPYIPVVDIDDAVGVIFPDSPFSSLSHLKSSGYPMAPRALFYLLVACSGTVNTLELEEDLGAVFERLEEENIFFLKVQVLKFAGVPPDNFGSFKQEIRKLWLPMADVYDFTLTASVQHLFLVDESVRRSEDWSTRFLENYGRFDTVRHLYRAFDIEEMSIQDVLHIYSDQKYQCKDLVYHMVFDGQEFDEDVARLSTLVSDLCWWIKVETASMEVLWDMV